MNIAEYSIKKKTVTLALTVVLIVGGILSFQGLSRLEDPEFTIKQARVITSYPGATPTQVEEEVSEVIETAVQQLGQLKEVRSVNTPGLSVVEVEIQDKYDKASLPQVWDELRRKVNDAQKNLPPGAGPSIVNDDFGDVFGILFALVGEGYTYKELEEFADYLRRELLLVPDVAKVIIAGVQPQEVHIKLSRNKLAQLGISLNQIYHTLGKQNLVQPSGALRVENEYIHIKPTGEFTSVEEIGNVLIQGRSNDDKIFLKDIASIERAYKTPPDLLTGFNGQKSLVIGISIASGGNVVTMSEAVKAKIEQLKFQTPLGMEIKTITFQSDFVTESINGFIISLIEALAIVIGILMIFMGLRSGILIGLVLLLTVMGTFIFMDMWGISLERISLGALIIALGMLVDNAIVVTEGMLIKMQSGTNAVKAAREVVSQTMMPLLGATVIAILAFAAIGLSQDSTGEYTRSLFQVILISLMLSWIVAITITPLLCKLFFKVEKSQSKPKDPYQGFIFTAYRGLLTACLRFRWVTMGVMIAALAASIYGFGLLENSFFPQSSRPQFMVHFWLPQGTDIRHTRDETQKLEKFIRELDHVTDIATFIGQGAPRFLLTYTPEQRFSSYALLLVNVDDYEKIDGLMATIAQHTEQNFPNAQPTLRKFVLGPGRENSLEARFLGPNPSVLRQLSEQAKQVMRDDGGAVGIRDDWRERVKLLQPQFAEIQARAVGITKADVDRMMQTTFSGDRVGVYREDIKLLPILSMAPDEERKTVDNINNLQIWSPLAQGTIPLRQVISGVETEWQDSVIKRKDRKRAITAQASQKTGNSSVVFNRIRGPIEAIDLPPGYELEWVGEYYDSTKAQAALFAKIPPTIMLVILILIMLFNAIRQPLIIVLTVPLSIIGVTIGLMATGQSFGFMALLGFLSLSGMLIKNAIVLIDQIDFEISEGTELWDAIIHSSVARMRPVAMAAITTVLGMIPLLADVFFVAMAVTIMAGLTFATILTLIVVPVLYAILFKAKEK